MRTYKFNNDENQKSYSFPQIKDLYYDLKQDQINLPPFLNWLDAKIRDKEITEIPEEIEISWSTKIVISDEDIEDIISSAMCGSVNYWCDRVKIFGLRYGNNVEEHFSRGGVLAFCVDEKEYILTRGMLLKAIIKWIDHPIGSKIYCEFVIFESGHLEIDPGYCDANLSDILIQLALFDEVIYG